ncbi:hypothetical protein JB92DRAFT_582838 [Gautieria morchelliformis]|nr:hypothetical protein JB92DRAFT_582838 [Gautieria morchelliformis]
MFGEARRNERFKCKTNTTWLMVDGQTILVTSGQTLDDVYKYLDLTDERLTVATHPLRWRYMAPTAPDTLALIVPSTPHIYHIGNQPSAAMTL